MAKSKREQLENVYQDVAMLISRNAELYHVYDDTYPKLVIKDDVYGGKYEIIIKEVK